MFSSKEDDTPLVPRTAPVAFDVPHLALIAVLANS
jgi:hypothetical protein